MTDLSKEAVKAIAFVRQYSKSVKQHPQPASLIDVAERMVAEIERLQDLVRLVRNQLLSENLRGLHLSPIEVASAVRDNDAETEGLIAKAAEAKEE